MRGTRGLMGALALRGNAQDEKESVLKSEHY